MTEPTHRVVTFLFTDIEGSTRLWVDHPEAMRAALAQHDALMRAAMASRNGRIFTTVGDAFCTAFADAPAALDAALRAQRHLAAENWSTFGPAFPALRVRMALHSGEADERDGDYFGPTLNRTARLLAAGHGGQVLISETTRSQLGGQLPDGLELRDLGLRRLRDLREPEQVFQLVAPDLPGEFPPLATLDARPNNLSVQLTSLVGRETEIAELTALLRSSGGPRLITLTGPGGTGKTRLALQTAANLIDDFAHGVWFVDLAALDDPALIPATVAKAVDIQELSGQPILAAVRAWVATRDVLLVLDNFEQLLAGASVVSELLGHAPKLRVLVTSRALLRLAGEWPRALEPLPAPSAMSAESVDTLAAYPAVELFVQRAAAARGDFALTGVNAPTVAAICTRLDGLPLAIELAAARTRMLPPDVLLERLEKRLELLTGGRRDAPFRQQTIRATIGWSHDLLDEPEQRLFRELSVFVDGWTLEAAEAACDAHGDPAWGVMEGLASLIDKSLVRAGSGEVVRFAMLETIREYARERLEAAGGTASTEEQRARFYADFAGEAWRSHAAVRDASFVHTRIAPEAGNLRATLEWCERHDPTRGLFLLGALVNSWEIWQTIEAKRWVPAFLDRAGDCPITARATGYLFAGGVAYAEGNVVEAARLYRIAVALYTEAGDDWWAALAHLWLGMALIFQGRPGEARPHIEAAATLGEQESNLRALSEAYVALVVLADLEDREDDVRTHWEAQRALCRALGLPTPDLEDSVGALNQLAFAAYLSSDLVKAARHMERLVHLLGAQDSSADPNFLDTIGRVQLARGDIDRAESTFHQGLDGALAAKNQGIVIWHVEGLADVARRRGASVRAATLRGAAAAMRRELESRPEPVEVPRHEAEIASLRSVLGVAAFKAAWAKGEAMTLDEVAAFARATDKV